MTEAEISQKQIEYRKHQDSLKISGKAMIALGLWTSLRLILTMLLGENNLRTFIINNFTEGVGAEEINEAGINIVIVILFVLVLLICLIGFLINYVAGIGAYREGKGGKKGTAYIVITVLILLGTVWTYVDRLLPKSPQAVQAASEDTFLNESGSYLLDFTQLLICIEILYAMVKSRKIGKELEKEQAV